MFKVLIVEDDVELRQLFQSVFIKNGYNVKGVSNGKEAIDVLENNYYDLIVTDIMMPVMNGYDFIQSIRDCGNNTPVMMITAKDQFSDMQLGFLSGTDDYMVKPVNVNEMVLRAGALLRRAKMTNEKRIIIGNTILELDTVTVYTNGEPIILPLKEFLLLYKMASYIGKIFTRQELMNEIWGYDADTDTHTVDVHIERLRKKFRDNPDFEIVTMRGIGYKVIKSEKNQI